MFQLIRRLGAAIAGMGGYNFGGKASKSKTTSNSGNSRNTDGTHSRKKSEYGEGKRELKKNQTKKYDFSRNTVGSSSKKHDNPTDEEIENLKTKIFPEKY